MLRISFMRGDCKREGSSPPSGSLIYILATSILVIPPPIFPRLGWLARETECSQLYIIQVHAPYPTQIFVAEAQHGATVK